MKNVKYWNINSDASFKIIHLSNWVMKKSYFWFCVLNEFPKSKSDTSKFLCPTNRIVFDPKWPFFTKNTHIFWVPTMMRKRKRIILMQWYNSIKQNLNYLRFESTRVLHTNFQESVHVPSVNESSVFAILNILCNLRITDFRNFMGNSEKFKHNTFIFSACRYGHGMPFSSASGIGILLYVCRKLCIHDYSFSSILSISESALFSQQDCAHFWNWNIWHFSSG